jgi:5-(carboxyamino)imidazole ribonucleotide synthase
MAEPVAPGGTVGILGGGQLGRMMALAAAELGLSCHIYSPEAASPAFAVAKAHTVAGWDDAGALAAFAEAVDVVTYEFENVPAPTADFLAARVPVRPRPEALAVAQDRLTEKALMAELRIPTAPAAAVERLTDIYAALAKTGRPALLKTRRLGYDGKGQAMLRQGDDPVTLWRSVGEQPSILEAFVAFEREISVVLARGLDGSMRAYDVTENRHENQILVSSAVPARIAAATAEEAVAIASRIADALDYVGVLAVEMFLLGGAGGPRLLVNEIAPRVHNSGHWTQDACLVSQFEQHIRAVCGWPLGDPVRHSDAEMLNLLGDAASGWQRLAAEPGARLHLYGKAEARPGRKMGHLTRIRPRS